MRFLSILSLASLLMSAPAFAADLGTYRPGAPYHSVIAPAADVCENQCAGDAQCRGWNYVKVNPRAPGVCEFNSKPAKPIESAISISGQGASLIAPNVSIGATNTIRVGTSQASKPRSTIRQTSPDRRVIRQAVPQQVHPTQSVVRRPIQSLTAQQNFHRQTPSHIARAAMNSNRPVGSGAQRLVRDPRIQMARPLQTMPQFSHALDGPQQQMMQAKRLSKPLQNSRPPIGVPITPRPQATLPQGSVNNPVTHQNAEKRLREAEVTAAQRAAIAPRLSVEQAQASLFGSLNDDVSAPRPMLNLPAENDVPIATSQSRPTIAVSQEPIGVLAGG